jgi:hypothetical protein
VHKPRPLDPRSFEEIFGQERLRRADRMLREKVERADAVEGSEFS